MNGTGVSGIRSWILGPVLWLAAVLLSPTAAFAYPGFIGHGYTSCSVCHYNPLGNGPLTDYGRALGATEIAARPFYATSKTTEEDLADQSGFLGSKPLPPWLRLAGAYRGLEYATGTKPEDREFINMQAEGSVILQTPDQRLYAVGTFGYVPVPETVPANQQSSVSTLISREHYVAYRPIPSVGIYAGLMDDAFGIRIPDHIAYSRMETDLTENDQSHGIMVHLAGKKWDGAIQGLIGNLSQSPDLRQKGFCGTFEGDVGTNFRLGASLLSTENDYRGRRLAAVHARVGTGEGSSILFETGLINTLPTNQPTLLGQYAFFQEMLRLTRGLYALATLDFYTDTAFGGGTDNFRISPGLDYFPMQRLEVRLDFEGTTVTGSPELSPDIYALMLQVHVWL